ncbi:MAG: sarcosine oxidase subunit gamma [Pseudotabrizicola sp.]|uniref:sarcosine oxidase subunit gamma n=1 Tax=Pseudotabrizicola sp. TaxID=2939647 RepID=UPI0027313ABA|nr:sarcosine oxidase subunit gamma [Pseudotabrizicola sp.]MDP2082876.1 sarcosine oxidase subunit gamma [Pseudotabrizicola sp.]MDZ7574408.1 sarcosine oxidase subunit gamma [Pseudotabrizicola sp.]
MPDLIAKSALGFAPFTLAGTTLAEVDMGQITAIAPFPGQSEALSRALGMAFPAPGAVTQSGDARLVWAGRDIAFLIGPVPPDGLPAAVTDQSDGWVSLALTGACTVDVLARLVPLDLRAAQSGQVFRTALNHLPLIVLVGIERSFTLLTYRSMAKTAWHEITEAMVKVGARAATG